MQKNIYGFYVPCSHVAILTAFAEQQSIKMEAILRIFDLSALKVNTPDALMPAAQYSQLLLAVDTAAAELGKQDDFWFRFASKLDFPAYGVLGQALLSCDNARQAMILLVKYYPILSCGSELTYNKQGEDLSLNIHRQIETNSRESIIKSELLVSTIINGMRTFLPDNGNKLSINFDYEKPAYHSLYAKYLVKSCTYSTAQAGIIIPASYLILPCPHSNPVMLNILTQQLDQIMISLQGPKSVAAKVRTLITAIPGSYPSVNEIAEKIGLSPRTLSRQLKEHNTTYQALVNQVKSQQAINYLQTTTLSIEQISERVGFGDSANFRRAFIDWTGMTPSKFRKQKQE